MIEFGNFYQLIAKNHLSHWLETLPAQIAAWQREQQHGLFKTVVERGRIFTGNDALAAGFTAQRHG
ncbi:tRNA (5-methoxyuridine) 34 synthase [Salmonella enterica subsp. enterica]|nr:tRNA (5-methoxyuridine) 34 synthase [Salmonella enterica subsp. enterica]